MMNKAPCDETSKLCPNSPLVFRINPSAEVSCSVVRPVSKPMKEHYAWTTGTKGSGFKHGLCAGSSKAHSIHPAGHRYLALSRSRTQIPGSLQQDTGTWLSPEAGQRYLALSRSRTQVPGSLQKQDTGTWLSPEAGHRYLALPSRTQVPGSPQNMARGGK